MLSFQLRKEAEKLLAAFEKASVFFTMLDAIGSSFPEVDNFLIQIGEGGDKTIKVANQLRNHLAQLRNVVAKINIREFYVSLEDFQRNLNQAKEYGLDDLKMIDGISRSIDIFAAKYGKFIQGYTPETAAPVITEARKLSSQLGGFKTALLFFKSNLEEQHYNEKDYETLSILLTTKLNLKQLAVKLAAIDIIYNELCSLLSISTTENPLIVNKIELGSLWIKVFGNSRVIGLMVDFLNSSVLYIYRNFTNEGKLSAIPKKVEIIDSVLEFTSKLELAGINTSEAKEHISKATVAIAKELNYLIDGEVEITVNNRTYSIGDEVQKQLLEVGEPLKLEYRNSEENTNN